MAGPRPAAARAASSRPAGKKAPAPRSSRPAAVSKGAQRGAVATVIMIAITLLAIVALPLCALLLAGSVPTMVAALIDRYRAKYLTRTVGAMNLAGIAPIAVQLWTHSLTFNELMLRLGNPMSWLMMYGAAALGWALFAATPPLARVIVDLRADQMQSDLKARAKKLVSEWGEEVTGRAKQG